MTQGKPLRHLIVFALPLMLGSALQLMYTFVDSVVVGRLIGLSAFAAVGAAGQSYWLVFSALLGLSHGFSARIAQCFGARDERATARAVAMCFVLLCGVALGIGWLAGALVRPALRLQNLPEALLPMSSGYLRLMLFGLPVSAAYLAFGAAFRAMGDSKTPLYALVFSTLLNIALDIALVRLTNLGVMAVALATLLAQACSCLWCLLRLRQTRTRWTQRDDWRFHPESVRQLLRLGIPGGFRDLVIGAGGVWVQSYINAYGELFIAGMTAAMKLYSLLEIAGGGMEGAIATFVAQNFGAKRIDRVREGVSVALRAMLIGALVEAVLVFALRRPLLSLFITGANAAAALNVALTELHVMLVLLPSLYLLLLYRAALAATGNALMAMLSGFVELSVRLLCVLALPALIGVWGVYLSIALGWPAALAQLLIAYKLHIHRIERE